MTRPPYCQVCDKDVESVKVVYDNRFQTLMLELSCHGVTARVPCPHIDKFHQVSFDDFDL